MKKIILALSLLASISSYSGVVSHLETVIVVEGTNCVTNTVMVLDNGMTFTNYTAHAYLKQAMGDHKSTFTMNEQELAIYREALILTKQIADEIDPSSNHFWDEKGWFQKHTTDKLKAVDTSPEARYLKEQRLKDIKSRASRIRSRKVSK